MEKNFKKKTGKLLALLLAFCLFMQGTAVLAVASAQVPEETEKFTVTYVVNDETVLTEEYELNDIVTVKSESEAKGGVETRKFYWWDTGISTNHYHVGDSFAIKENITLTAFYARIAGCIHNTIIGDRMKVHYVDENNTEIAAGYTEDSSTMDVTNGYSAIPLKVADIEGYTYSQEYYYMMYGSGRTVTGLTGNTIDLRATDVIDEEITDDGYSEYNVYLKYTRNPSPEEYHIIYDANGGTGTVKDEQAYSLDDEVSVLDGVDLTRDGHSFSNWNTQADGGGDTYNAKDILTIKQDQTLFAQWKEMEDDEETKFTVVYDSNGGKGSVKDETEYDLNDTVKVRSAEELSKDGFTFTGWNTNADGTGSSYQVDDTFEIAEDVTLFAQWKEVNATTTPKPTEKATNTPSRTTYTSGGTTSTSVKTGDESNVSIYMAGILLALIVGYGAWKRRKAMKG